MDLRRVDLNLLVAFDALMVDRNVTSAASRLSVGQPAMSATLKRLRRLFDDPILERRGRNMVATPLAASLVSPVRQLLADTELLLRSRRHFDPATDARMFTIMASEYSTITLLHPLMTTLRTDAPNVRIRVVPVSARIEEPLANSDLDLVLSPPETVSAAEMRSLAHERLFVDTYVVALDRKHPDVGEQLTLEQFSDLPYLAITFGDTYALVEGQLDRLGVPRRTEVATGFGTAPFLLQDTRLIMLMPSTPARMVARRVGLRLLEPPIPLGEVSEAMYWHPSYTEESGHLWLRSKLRDAAQQAGEFRRTSNSDIK
ncbi:LysR family transcriptional regulator [Nocardia sp. NPDC050412]|uniref:LysR family transcriptional regulator n=1 Tax=unclassified Nocardia TaxID=2637762 RepID=UPI003791A925